MARELTPEQLAHLQALTRDAVETRTLTADADGKAQLAVPMRTYDVVLIDVD